MRRLAEGEVLLLGRIEEFRYRLKRLKASALHR